MEELRYFDLVVPCGKAHLPRGQIHFERKFGVHAHDVRHPGAHQSLGLVARLKGDVELIELRFFGNALPLLDEVRGDGDRVALAQKDVGVVLGAERQVLRIIVDGLRVGLEHLLVDFGLLDRFLVGRHHVKIAGQEESSVPVRDRRDPLERFDVLPGHFDAELDALAVDLLFFEAQARALRVIAKERVALVDRLALFDQNFLYLNRVGDVNGLLRFRRDHARDAVLRSHPYAVVDRGHRDHEDRRRSRLPDRGPYAKNRPRTDHSSSHDGKYSFSVFGNVLHMCSPVAAARLSR